MKVLIVTVIFALGALFPNIGSALNSEELRRQELASLLESIPDDNMKSFLREEGYLVTPACHEDKCGLALLDDQRQIAICFIYPEDLALATQAQLPIPKDQPVDFNDELLPTIIINNQVPFSDFWKKVNLLSASVQAFSSAMIEQSGMGGDESTVAREYFAYEQVCSFLDASGDTEYQRILGEKIIETKKILLQEKMPPFNYKEGEATLFFSKEEDKYKQKIAWIHSVYRVVQEIKKEEAQMDTVINFIRWAKESGYL
ncbi:MAG: hypothetical protein WAV16_03780 [Candidatus Moraniibacteriota bacterium]